MLGDGRVNGVRCALKMNGNGKPIMGPWMWKGTFLMQSYPKANSQHTVDFIRYIQQRRPGPQVLIFWDGASYHYQQAMRAFLKTIQAHRPPDEWKVRCMRLAPYTPQENPVEDIWLKGKTFVRTHALWTTSFEQIKDLSPVNLRSSRMSDSNSVPS